MRIRETLAPWRRGGVPRRLNWNWTMRQCRITIGGVAWFSGFWFLTARGHRRRLDDMPNTLVTPYPLAVVICDLAWRDPGTGKTTLLGCFSAVMGRTFPLSVFSLGLYVALTDGRGKMPIRMRIIDTDETREPVVETECEVEFSDPRMIVELCLNMQGLVFPEAGEYRCQVFAGGEFLIERRILAVQAGDKPDSQSEDKGEVDQ